MKGKLIMIHVVKEHEKYVDSLLMGFRTAEIRRNDRPYKKGDKLWINIIGSNGVPKDETIIVTIYDVLNIDEICEGYVLLSIRYNTYFIE